MISVDAFATTFQSMPHVVSDMKANFLNNTAMSQTRSRRAYTSGPRGRPSLTRGGKIGIPPDFVDAVFEALDGLHTHVGTGDGRVSPAAPSPMKTLIEPAFSGEDARPHEQKS